MRQLRYGVAGLKDPRNLEESIAYLVDQEIGRAHV
jgi:hypothetical protein